ncbi:MAG: acetylxylan esterase [Gemmataceae bacterium]|nr:acetylxylan esterase [Gemmataceae bacterium]
MWRYGWWLWGVLGMVPVAWPADLPPPERLPSRPEMPHPLEMLNGERITTREAWEKQRRPELKALFQHYMYGEYPPRPKQVQGRVLFEDRQFLAGKATLQEVELTFGPESWPKIYLLVAWPNQRQPVPCFIGLNFGGNHLLVAHEQVRIPTVWVPGGFPGVVQNRATAEGRGKHAQVWPLEQILARGYAVATFYCGDIQPDRPHVAEGMRATMPLRPTETGQETATLMWWAWGIHNAVDYLLTLPHINGKRLAVVGHSRLGKTALLAGAFDERIAIIIPHQSGCGGAAPSRHNNPKAETVSRINITFPHWFCGRFKSFGADVSRLPFDQNCLVALCAPRPVLLTNAEEDEWANPAGQFAVLRAAAPAYELYDVEKPVVADQMPPVNSLSAQRLGYFLRPGKHAMTPADWQIFMDYCDRWGRP